MPSREEAEVFESGGFVAAGFPWWALGEGRGGCPVGGRLRQEATATAARGAQAGRFEFGGIKTQGDCRSTVEPPAWPALAGV